MVDGGDRIRAMSWDAVGGIMQRGGTIIGTARCAAFRTRAGRLQAARNLLERNIDSLVVIGGDGSLSGADVFRREWPGLLAELVQSGAITQELAERHTSLAIVGLVGSIDNDMSGTDMTIGADTALQRITQAIDAISSTAASHQRTFVIEVMGRNCGYLALMGALATGADSVLIPENPPDADDWQLRMCDALKAGRKAGRRDNIVIVAEGARDRQGKPISSASVKEEGVRLRDLEADLGHLKRGFKLGKRLGLIIRNEKANEVYTTGFMCTLLEEEGGELFEVRQAILGHLQQGGDPTPFDRIQATRLAARCIDFLIDQVGKAVPAAAFIGLQGGQLQLSSLEDLPRMADEAHQRR